MRSTFHSLEVAKRGLFAQQTAIATTGHNISNANTVGYSRQVVNFKASSPMEMPSMTRTNVPGQLGTGVTFDSIRRIREGFLDDQYRNEAQAFGSWSVQRDTLEKLELIFDEPSDSGLRAVIDQFWNAWQDLSREPDNLTARAVVKERTQAMIDAFQYTDTKMAELNRDLTANINVKVGEANNFIRQIAQLNQEIRRIEGLGDNANDLRDQRDLITDQLSKIVQIQSREQANGMYTITLPDGTALVDGLQSTMIGEGVALEQITGGEIFGMMKSRDVLVAEYQSHLNTMFQGLITGKVDVKLSQGSILPIDVTYRDVNGVEQTLTAGSPVPANGITVEVDGINGLHKLGWTMREDGDGKAIPGGDFFISTDGSWSINSIRLNPDISTDVGMIAASIRVDGNGNSFSGNGGLALVMGQLRDGVFNFRPELPASAGKGTFDEYFRSVIGGLGVKTQEATRQALNQETILKSVDNRRESVSGVSLDEEMANLIKFQHAYNASARVMTTVDQLLDTIINRMGIVGR
ncbi:flagellar hook-associated protein FlgK [Caldalkalibacillus mannanilyticus]|uniref:flagellar hook-associated protein FlgK n=1 Tax=Caldalkalibacillus mannanilyticus TaxID=1418 RepID=UPI000469FA88|nr:flagellar hook-associated protein FlgK [Caldalkalibacillus mannanilyticus]